MGRPDLTVFVLALTLVAIIAGCESTSGPRIDVSGTYRINEVSPLIGGLTATATVQQSGRNVFGDYRNNLGNAFRIDGSVSVTHVTAQLIGTNNPDVCSVEGDFFPDGRAGQGSLDCQAGGRTVDSGSLTITRTGAPPSGTSG